MTPVNNYGVRQIFELGRSNQILSKKKSKYCF